MSQHPHGASCVIGNRKDVEALLSAHRWFGPGCTCGWLSDDVTTCATSTVVSERCDVTPGALRALLEGSAS